jgi:hypothetical protein
MHWVIMALLLLTSQAYADSFIVTYTGGNYTNYSESTGHISVSPTDEQLLAFAQALGPNLNMVATILGDDLPRFFGPRLA